MTKIYKYNTESSDVEFLKKLRNKVDIYFSKHNLSKKANPKMIIKMIIILFVFIGSYSILLMNIFEGWSNLVIALVFGLSNVSIVFNISHDASHNALFKNNSINKFFSYTFNLVGLNAYSWNVSHNLTHHIYPNVGDLDPDLYQAAPFVRVSTAQPLHYLHKYQVFYAPFLYLLHSFYLIFMKDFQDYKIIRKASYSLPSISPSKKQYVILIMTKIFYLFYSLIIPMIVIDVFWWKVLLGYLFVHSIMGLYLSLVLIPVHMVDDASFVNPTDGSVLETSWVKNIFNNTLDYSRRNKMMNYFFGGLNIHLEHHLFPDVCHIHLIKLTKITEDLAQEYGYKYRNLTMRQAIQSHFRLLKKMGR